MLNLSSTLGRLKSFVKFTNHINFKNRGLSDQPFLVPKYLLDRTVPAEHILLNLTPEDAQRLEIIKAEYKTFSDRGIKVPSGLKPSHLLELLCQSSKHGRLRVYEFLFKNEMKKQSEREKKNNKVIYTPDENVPPASNTRIIRLLDDRLFRLHMESRMWAEIRCPESSQRLVFDFSHESEMRLVDQKNLASQMTYVMQNTRLMKPYPFHLTLCGLKPQTNQYSFMEDAFGVKLNNGKLTDLPWTISPNHYSVDFPINDPNQRVVYLSPNSHRMFEPGEWDHTAVYVIGAIVDKAIRRPVTSAKARRDGVECIRLPLERYFKWSAGRSKTLTINCMHAILATAKETNGDWELALRKNLPRRLYESNEGPSRRLDKIFSLV